MGKRGSQSFCKSSSLPLLPPHAFPLLRHGVRHGVLPWLRPARLLHRALPSGCREQPPPPPPSSLAWLLVGLTPFLSHFLPHCQVAFGLFLNRLSQRCRHHCWQASAVPCSRAVAEPARTSCVQHRAVPNLLTKAPAANTSPPTPLLRYQAL